MEYKVETIKTKPMNTVKTKAYPEAATSIEVTLKETCIKPNT